MNRIKLRRILSALLLATCAMPVGSVSAAVPQEPPPPSTSLRIIALRHATARDIAATLEQVVLEPFDSVTVDERTNSLLLMTTGVRHEEIMQVIEELDVPLEEGEALPGHIVRVFTLRHAAANDHLASMLQSLFGQRPRSSGPRGQSIAEPLRVAYDASTNQVIARGTPPDVDAFAKLVEAVDRPPADRVPGELEIRLVWLVSGLDENQTRPVPPDLGDVIRELEAIGITGLRRAAQTLVRVSVTEEFQAEFSADLVDTWAMSFTGETFSEAPGVWKLRVAVGGGAVGGSSSVTLDTTISTTSGHFVVLGATPIQALDSVFVIQVNEVK